MNQQIGGLDPSVASTTSTVDNVTANSANSTVSYQYPDAPTQQTNPENRCTEAEISKIRAEDTSRFVNFITVPSLRVLLTQVLTTIDVAIPNKDQNRAVKRTVREDFDTAYFGILGRAYPECNYASSEGRFALDPAPVKEGNSSLG
jgi:hypothetical protein